MPLNIKDEYVHQQARQLAELTGESITSAVRKAVSEKLDNFRKEKIPKKSSSVEELLALARTCAAHMRNTTSDHSDLYDEMGLPK